MKDDRDFLALGIKLETLIWSNNLELKKQERVKILTTAEVIEVIFGKI